MAAAFDLCQQGGSVPGMVLALDLAGYPGAIVAGPRTPLLFLQMKHEATVVAPVTEGVPWLGFRVFPGLVRLDAASRRRFTRKLAESWRRALPGHPEDEGERDRGASLCGYLRLGHTHALRGKDIASLDREMLGG